METAETQTTADVPPTENMGRAGPPAKDASVPRASDNESREEVPATSAQDSATSIESSELAVDGRGEQHGVDVGSEQVARGPAPADAARRHGGAARAAEVRERPEPDRSGAGTLGAVASGTTDDEQSHIAANAESHAPGEPTGEGQGGYRALADQVADGPGKQIADAAASIEVEDVPTGEAHDETGTTGQADDASDAAQRARPAGVKAGTSFEAELQQADEEEAGDVAETGIPVGHVEETPESDDPIDNVDRLPDATGNEEIAVSGGEARREVDSEVGSHVANGAETAATEEPGLPATDEARREIIAEERISAEPARRATPDTDGLSEEPEVDGGFAQLPTGEAQRRTTQYRPPTGGPPRGRPPTEARSRSEGPRKVANRGWVADVDVRVIFQRGGYCSVSLLPKRLPGLPEELTVSGAAGDVEFQALQDEWYQDVIPDDLGDLLRTGFVWRHGDTGQEWLLSGRQVFVLAHGTTHRGYVSCPRLALGRDHVVLCTATHLGVVEGALRAAGCAGWTQLGQQDGAPSGWLVLRGVVPHNPIPPSGDSDILNVLRPLPEIEIALEGGIRLAYNSWLLGYPPAIRIYGNLEHTASVLIDGQEATESKQGGLSAQGWDAEGDHHIWCSGLNRTYSLVRSEAQWTYWPAHSFKLRGGENQEFEFCGPLVRPVVMNAQPAYRQAVQVPPTNPVLLGASPGHVFLLHRRPELRGAVCLGLAPFDPVWALPAQPLQCEKRTSRILLVGEPVAPPRVVNRRSARGGRDIEMWCRFVLDANRKGLAVEPASPETNDLWREYKRVARNLWRRRGEP
ncbi:MAG TPA: hypothetical protein VM324_14535 [Egibacteraceae bacterium]|nr:hypothetical protein [Egibacteraceae bacterium]